MVEDRAAATCPTTRAVCWGGSKAIAIPDTSITKHCGNKAVCHSITVLITLLQAVQYDHNYVELFTPLEYSYTGAKHHDKVFKYRLFEPATTDPQDKKPLIVWLHGRGEAGEDNVAQLGWLFKFMFPPPWIRERYPFFVLAVQCPSDNRWWTGDGKEGSVDMVDVVASILEQTINDHPVDVDRISLVGISSGGTGCWNLAVRHPELFAAVAPCGSAGENPASLTALIHVPIWAFHNTGDSMPIRFVRETVRALHEAGGDVHLTEFDAEGHDCWSAAFENYDLLNWLLSQRRTQVSWMDAPGPSYLALSRFVRSWKWWQILLQIGVPIVLFVIIRRIVLYRRQSARSSAEKLLDRAD